MTDQKPEGPNAPVDPGDPPRGREETNFYQPYADFAKNLRTWFLAFGVGAPVLFLTNKEAGEKLIRSGSGVLIAFAFLAGVAVQVLTALMYKTAMWYLYMGELDSEEEKERFTVHQGGFPINTGSNLYLTLLLFSCLHGQRFAL